MRALLQKCARKTVTWQIYLPAGHHLAAIVNFRAPFSLTPARRADMRKPMGITRAPAANARDRETIHEEQPSN